MQWEEEFYGSIPLRRHHNERRRTNPWTTCRPCRCHTGDSHYFGLFVGDRQLPERFAVQKNSQQNQHKPKAGTLTEPPLSSAKTAVARPIAAGERAQLLFFFLLLRRPHNTPSSVRVSGNVGCRICSIFWPNNGAARLPFGNPEGR